MYENAFICGDMTMDVPVRFGHAPEEREYLKKERTIDEMLDFIYEKDIQYMVQNTIFNNDVGFGHSPVEGKLRKADGKYYVDIFCYFGEPMTEPMSVDISEEIYYAAKNALETAYVIIGENDEPIAKKEDGHENWSVMIIPRTRDNKEKELSDLVLCNLIEAFLTYAKINTYHKLGKVINKGMKIFQEYTEEHRGFCSPFFEI